jgi:hypothetical protein
MKLNGIPILSIPGHQVLELDPIHWVTVIEYQASGRPPERMIYNGQWKEKIEWGSSPRTRTQVTIKETANGEARHIVILETGDAPVEPWPKNMWLQPNMENGGKEPPFEYQHCMNTGDWFSDQAQTVLRTGKELETSLSTWIAPVQGQFVVLDIEHLDFGDPAQCAKVVALAKEIKSLRPDITLGMYGEMPVRNFWGPVHYATGMSAWERYLNGEPDSARFDDAGHTLAWAMDGVAKREPGGGWVLSLSSGWSRELLDWKRQNDQRAANLIDGFDVLCPSLYIPYPFGEDTFTTDAYLNSNIDEAIRIGRGKPIRAFMSHNIEPASIPLSPSEWRHACRTVASRGVGMVDWYPKFPSDTSERYVRIAREEFSGVPQR